MYPAADRTVDLIPFLQVSFFSTINRPKWKSNGLSKEDKILLDIKYDLLQTEVINKFLIDLLKTKTKFVQEKTFIFDCEFWSTCFMEVMLISLSTFF